MGWKRLEEPAVILDFIHCTRLEPYQTSTMEFFAKTTKITVLHGCFSDFLNCTNGAKSHKASHMYDIVINMRHSQKEMGKAYLAAKAGTETYHL